MRINKHFYFDYAAQQKSNVYRFHGEVAPSFTYPLVYCLTATCGMLSHREVFKSVMPTRSP
jgi:hypothetical protein